MKNSTKPICGAKAKQTGKPCEKPPLKGRDRCKLHGGKTPKGQNAGKTNGNYRGGLYTAYLTDAEREAWAGIELGKVDEELRMCRIWLTRAMALENDLGKGTAGLEVSEIRRSESLEFSKVDTITRRPDTFGRINQLIGRIALLEKTRAELRAAASVHPGVDVRFVVEAPADESMSDWLKTYAGGPHRPGEPDGEPE